ncbi:tRNA (5-methylaminomethyl-2-thiouridine)(34)-methyltransferase MnmD [Oscillospiraceae bacterium N12]|jgi:tRNA U34 5-methylaminomethyl-2-thiouridine-forming methyltransferase MnmC|uniref:tRNA (5-methylaminomethyl-2-thiouridine)(34)-methyltransferase MnmD n=1 Tax=Jilunia laotingensis TaxID=2763675 RepID=A0A926F120_9BACT|nr:tRNA (5-methylaminomethyl-2-thiouridine)(34)-methyltransferase MnmD [Jilunia laotingensis]MBC8592691.1 tRNA (5-methylaminomethyl-2-thiouridine)(34)-methyltransferase MnmD [Jilunia laotingensis]
MERIIEQTADGSATLFVPELDEHYHSVKGARTESQHIFIDMGLKASEASEPRILEIGFGTGLNALLTLEAAEATGKKIHYTGIELYPLPWETVDALKYSDHPLFKTLHTTPWEEDVIITPNFTLKKVQADARTSEEGKGNCYDLIYFDAFAPDKQPEMWSQELFDQLYVILHTGGILTTYCAKGTVRRMLQSAGFIVERLPGPPGGKREILRARKP